MRYTPLSIQLLQLYLLTLLFFTSHAILTIIFPLQAASTGRLEGEIGFLMGIYMLTCMALRPWAGQFVQKYSAHTIMKILLCLHLITLLIYILFGVPSLYLVRILQGVATAFFSMTLQIGIADLLHDKYRGQGMSLYLLSTVLPNLYGPALAFLLWNFQSEIPLQGFIFLLAVLPLLLFIRSPLRKNRQNEPLLSTREMILATKRIAKIKDLRSATIILFIGAAIFGTTTIFVPLFLLVEQVANPAIYLSMQAFIVVAARFIFKSKIPSDGKWHPSFVKIVLLCSALGTTLLAFGVHIGEFIYIASLFNGIAFAMLYPTVATYMTFLVPKNVLGTYLGAYDLGFFAGTFLLGIIAQSFSFSIMFGLCTAFAIIAIFFCNERESIHS